MATFVDPDTGEEFENDADDAAERAAQFGLISKDEYDYQQRPLAERAEDSAAGFGASVARGVLSPIEVAARAVHPETAESLAALRKESYGSPEALQQRERDPLLSGIGEQALPIVTGLLTGGAGTSLSRAAAGMIPEAALTGITSESIGAAEEARDFDPVNAAQAGAIDLATGVGAHSLMRLAHLGPGKVAADVAQAGAANLYHLTRGVAGNKFVQGIAGDVVEDLTSPAFKLGGAAAGFGVAGPVGAFAGYIAGKRTHKLVMQRGVRPAIGLAGDIASGGHRIDEHAAGYWLGKKLRRVGPIASRAMDAMAAAAKKYGGDAAGLALATTAALGAASQQGADDSDAAAAAMGIGLFSRRLFKQTWRGAQIAGKATLEGAQAAGRGIAKGAGWLAEQPGVQHAVEQIPKQLGKAGAKYGRQLGRQAAQGLLSPAGGGIVGGALGATMGPIGAAAGEAIGKELGPRIGNVVLDWFRKRADKTTTENVAAAVEEAVQAGAARAEVAEASKAATQELGKEAAGALDALAKETPQQRVAAMRASTVRLGGNAKLQREELSRVLDEMASGLSKIDPNAAQVAGGFAAQAREQIAKARTAQERYRIGVSLVETLTDHTARAGDGEMGKVFGAYAERMWETLGRSEIWLSPTELAKESKRALKRQAKLIESVAAGEEIAESIARGRRPPSQDARAPVDAESVAMGTGLSHIFSKSGRAAEAWKGTARQAASIDARIAAYGQSREFLDLVQEAAATSRRTPWAKGHDRELWEIQKDVLDEHEALFPRVPYSLAEEAPVAARAAPELADVERVLDRAPGAAVGDASPKDAFLQTFLPRFRDRIDDEIEDETLEVFADMGRVPRRGSPEWRVAEDSVVAKRVARAKKEAQRGLATGEAMGVAAILGGGVAAGNVLAHARRRAQEEVRIEDLDAMPADEREAALAENGARYEQELMGRLGDALVDTGDAQTRARAALGGRLSELVSEPSDAQRQFAASAALGVAAGESALREGGYKDDAKVLEEALDTLIEAEVAHDQRLPVEHNAGKLLGQLVAAHDALRRHADELPADVAESLAALAAGTERTELWGDAAEMLRDLRATSPAALGASPDDPESLRSYLEAGVALADLVDRWSGDSDALRDALGAVDGAQRSLEGLRSAMAGAAVGKGTAGRGTSAVLEDAIREAGAGVSVDEVLARMPAETADMFGQGERVASYDEALRSIERGSGVAARRAARGAAGASASRQDADPDLTSAEFFAGYSDELAAFEARRDMLETIVTDPTELADAMASSYGHLAETHPDVYRDLTDIAVRATEVLTQAMPASVQVSLDQPGGLPPSVDDVRAFARVYMTVTQPETYLRDLEAGLAWPEQSEAFAAMYPGQWRLMAEEAVSVANQRSSSLTAQEATYLDLTFGIGNVIGGLWSDSGSAAIQSAIATAKGQKQAKPPGGGKAQTIPTMANQALGAGPSSLPVS